MSTHISAEPGQVAKTVLMPGDPLRALYIANNYMADYLRFNGIRGMYGYTGRSLNSFTVHPSGMTQPSLAIYVNELFMFHGVETIIRVGTFGSYQKDVPLGMVFLPKKATTDSAMFPGVDAAIPTWELLKKAKEASEKFNIPFVIGHVFSSDHFYDLKKYRDGEKKDWEMLAEAGVIGVEMESYVLFRLGEIHQKQTMTILVCSDNLVTGERMTAKERETSVNEMMKIVLEII